MKLSVRFFPFREQTPYWPHEDESVLEVITAEVDAKTVAYRDARRAHEQAVKELAQARQQLKAAEQGIIEAKRQAFLQAHHADLLARLDTVLQDDPTYSIDAMHPRYMQQVAIWRAQLHEVEVEIASVLEVAGV